MIIDQAQVADIPALRVLWMDAFGDSEDFWQAFLANAQPITHCRLARRDATVIAALYWFDCLWENKKIAYLYGVATLSAYRGQGVCRTLMEAVHRDLKEQGYVGCILHPGGPELFSMYEKLGYATCTYIRESECMAGEPIPLRQLTQEEYARLRREYLPQGGVVQEGQTLALLQAQSRFYTGENCLLVCAPSAEALFISELLGDEGAVSGILATLGCVKGRFRTPGKEIPFTMYHPLTDDLSAPAYFGLAMD